MQLGMSALGHKQTCAVQLMMSAFGPTANSCTAANAMEFRADGNLSANTSRHEGLDRPRRLLATMPDCVNLSGIGNIDSWIALEHHQIGKLA